MQPDFHQQNMDNIPIRNRKELLPPRAKQKKKEKPYNHSEEKPKEAEQNIPVESPTQQTLSISKQPEEKTREAPHKVQKKLLTSPDPENNSMNPPENSSSSQNPKSHIQKSEQNSPSPKVESSPTAKPATKEEDVGIEEIADYINEDFETQQTSPHSIQKKKKKKKKSTLR
eukprot:TRINITY_DN13658_c0_g1_i2.p2 TRINITY_DN13658_c0_g1~~TRINITY_DN13658_c0_g1_i2.p2  ORF type:complete len:171 (+),score=42.64 TRINITY_DN13658_c0_g1_i2:484-996(+)